MALRVALAQVGAAIGDVAGNTERVLAAWHDAARAGADLVVFTELTITGYPPEDLLLKPEFVAANLDAVRRLAADGPCGTVAIVGYVDTADGDLVHDAPPRRAIDQEVAAAAGRPLTNSAAVLADRAVVATYDKLHLPNYGVFDEARYFTARDRATVVRVAGVPIGVTVCEDLWHDDGPVAVATAAGARVITSLNASPYHRGKRAERERAAARHTRRDGTWIAYVNVVGGQDDVVFDGDSFLTGPDGEVHARAAQFVEDLVVFDVPVDPVPLDGVPDLPGHDAIRDPLPAHAPAPRLDPVGEVWQALVRATRDYTHRNGFGDVLLGVSGGIDSAVVAAIATDALGADHVTGVLLPSPYSSDHSVHDAEHLVDALGIRSHTLPISGPLRAAGEVLGELVVTGFETSSEPDHPGRTDERRPGVAYENLQSRLRGLLLMALSNETGALVLTTGNKSEYAVGYATLYGDMSGGFAPLKDVPKLLVYELARWRNRDGEVIPLATIDKPPSAELRPDQRDDDSLPPYEVLDDIIEKVVEDLCSVRDVVAHGHDEATVRQVIGLIDRAEYKRRQAAPGPKVTRRAFGRDRRVPITNAWRP